MKTKKRLPKKPGPRRPKDVWNSVRKLETLLRRADIQATSFMGSLKELRETVSLEVRSEIVKSLCETVNGDILAALAERRSELNEGRHGEKFDENALVGGVFEALVGSLRLTQVGRKGERSAVTRHAARDYNFEDYPESLSDESVSRFSVEIVRPGWKVDGRTVVKPKAVEVSQEIAAPAFNSQGGNGNGR